MSRKEAVVTVPLDGRDKGKVFKITEWPASKAEEWGIRGLLAVARSGADVPEEAQGQGMVGLAVAGLRSLVNVNSFEVIGLLNELMECVTVVPDPKRPEVERKLIEEDVEEVATRLFLKSEVFTLHTGFSWAGVKQKLTSALSSLASSGTPTSPAS